MHGANMKIRTVLFENVLGKVKCFFKRWFNFSYSVIFAYIDIFRLTAFSKVSENHSPTMQIHQSSKLQLIFKFI